MKKLIFLLISLFVLSTAFSQNYIGKGFNQIIISELYLISPDSTEIWEKKNVHIDLRDFKSENKLRIHDLDNFRVITCTIEDDTCVSFIVVYYNLSKDYIQKILDKKYNYDGNDSWTYCCGNASLQLCLKEMPGRIFVIEACNAVAEAKTTKSPPQQDIN